MNSANRRIERRALEWLARKDSDAWTDSDELDLERWRQESTANNVAYIRLQTVWNRADKLKVLGAGLPLDQLPAPEQFNLSAVSGEARPLAVDDIGCEDPLPTARQKGNARPRVRIAGWAAAASVLICTAWAFIWHQLPERTTYSTAIGELTAVSMRDGSRVTLNTDSKVRVAINGDQRAVSLERGEVYFEVARDSERPFVVDAGPTRVVVLGTKFSVRKLDDSADAADVEIVVTEGKVRVGGARVSLLTSAGRIAEWKTRELPPGVFELSAGQVARGGGAGMLIQTMSVAEAQEAVSWRLGLIIFRDVDLAQVAAELNRYNERKIVIGDPAIAAMRFSGKFRPTYLDAFVRLLEDGFPIQARAEEERIVLTSRTSP